MVKVLNQALLFTFFSLVIITPVLFSTQNTELFEVPKMIFVYLAAAILLFLTLVKFVIMRQLQIPKTGMLLTLAVFVAVQIVSTATSRDQFTSIFGYPSRLNGGLISQIAYLVIFATALVNINAHLIKKLTLAAIITAVAVALWGIPGHFGRDPNCFILTGRLDSTCWQKDFDPTLRIFSTLGQPNWLASYLVLVLPFVFAYFIIAKKSAQKIFFASILATLFTALIFTNSRAGLAGFAASVVIFLFLLGKKFLGDHLKIIGPLFLALLVISVIFAAPIVSRINEFTSGQEAARGPTESGQIRLIVWQGALDVFKKYPLLGSGPETFAYSYYQVRPLTHNQTSEWNFFYNKAHNEFLNHLANTGAVGALWYLIFLLTALILIFKIQKNPDPAISASAKASLSALIGYQVTLFFGFSVVTTQVLMILIIAYPLILAEKTRLQSYKLQLPPIVAKMTIVLILILTSATTIQIGRIYFADVMFARANGFDYLDQKVLTQYSNAINIYPAANPFYLAQASLSYAEYLAGLDDPASQKTLITQAQNFADQSLAVSPNNLITTRKIANSLLSLSQTDPTFNSKALEVAGKIPQLAPTDPQSYFALAKVQAGLGLNQEAIDSLNTTLKLKPDYLEAQQILEQLTTDN